MSFITSLFGQPFVEGEFKETPADINKQSVIIYFLYGKDSLDPLHQLEDRLRDVLEKKPVGVHDGHEIRMDAFDGRLYLYGPNAEVLYKTIKPTLLTADFMHGAVATLRFGSYDHEALEIEITVEW